MNLLSWVGQKIKLTDGKFWSVFFGAETWAGEPVSVSTAMQVGAFAGCVRLYAQTISTLPLGIWEKTADGRRARDDLDLQRLIRDEPNADQDAAEFWESVIAWLMAVGNAFGDKKFIGDRLVAIDLLNPLWGSLERNEFGAKQFRYRAPGKAERIITEDRLFHLRGLTMGADLGLSTVELGRQSLSSSRATERAAASHFANGMRPSGWLVYKGGTLEPDQRTLARQNLINPMLGAENAGKVGILEGEFDYRQMTIEPEAAQLLESRRFSVEDVCRWFGVPPILLSHASQGQTMWGSGIEQIVLGWYVLQLRPRLVRVERAIRRQLMSPAEKRQGLYVEFNAEGLLRGDSAARAEFYWKMLQVGGMTPNQICDKENLPRWVGGDRHFVNQTLAPLDEQGIPIKAAAASDVPAGRRAEDQNPPRPQPGQRPALEVVQ
jgi:HK97 family phage portal protein